MTSKDDRVNQAFDQHPFGDIRTMVAADPALAQVIRSLLFPLDVHSTSVRSKINPMPFERILAIETSISFNPSTAKTKRPKGREKLCWHITIQVFTNASKGLTDPAWKGFCLLRSPERVTMDALRLTRSSQCLTPFSSKWAASIAQIADEADEQSQMVGLIYSSPADGGTYYHQGQFLLISDPDLGAPKSARIFDLYGHRPQGIAIPEFVSTTSDGRNLSSRYKFQSRATTSSDRYEKWKTGPLKRL